MRETIPNRRAPYLQYSANTSLPVPSFADEAVLHSSQNIPCSIHALSQRMLTKKPHNHPRRIQHSRMIRIIIIRLRARPPMLQPPHPIPHHHLLSAPTPPRRPIHRPPKLHRAVPHRLRRTPVLARPPLQPRRDRRQRLGHPTGIERAAGVRDRAVVLAVELEDRDGGAGRVGRAGAIERRRARCVLVEGAGHGGEGGDLP